MHARSSIRPCRSGSLCCALVLVAALAWGDDRAAIDAPGFYDQSKHGWFWYEDPPAEPEVEQPQDPPVATARPVERNVSLANYSTEELWTLYPDDFQQLLNGLQKKAVQYPTEQNILEYLSIQDIARRKALAYANATQYVTQKRADLFTLNQVYPVSTPGVAARVRLQQDEISRTIDAARSDHALLFFVAPGCGFCTQQAEILAHFVDRHGWQVRPVDITAQPDLALRFKVSVTPTLLLIRQDRQESMAIATGVVTLPEIERKLAQAIRFLRGDTGPDSFTTYEFQRGSALDPAAILNTPAPWKGAATP